MDEQVRRALDQLRPPEAVKAQAWEGALPAPGAQAQARAALGSGRSGAGGVPDGGRGLGVLHPHRLPQRRGGPRLGSWG